jgi:hypothetical protein
MDGLSFISGAKAVYVLPCGTRDEKRATSLEPEAQRQIVALLRDPQSWWHHGFYTLVVPEHQPPDIGFLFRSDKEDLVIFFTGGMADGRFRGEPLSGLLDGSAASDLRAWRQRFACPDARKH